MLLFMDGRKETVTISPTRDNHAVYGWVGPVGQLTPQSIQFTFTPQVPRRFGGGFMKDDTAHERAEYILLPRLLGDFFHGDVPTPPGGWGRNVPFVLPSSYGRD